MLDILRDHLAQTATPEMCSVLTQAHAVFDRIGLENYEHQFEDLLVTSPDVEGGSQDIAADALELTKLLLKQILRDHGVVCTEEASVPLLTHLVNGLLDIQSYDDAVVLKQTAAMEGETIEVFAELMALVTPLAVENLMVELVAVDFQLLRRIEELAGQEVSAEEAAAQFERTQYFNAQLQKFRTLAGVPAELDTVGLIQDGVKLGAEFAVYLRRLGDRLPVYEPTRAAHELYAMALISSDGNSNPRAMIQRHLEHYVHDVGQITKIDMVVGDLLMKMSRQS